MSDILVIDDDPDMRALLRTVLLFDGHTVHEAMDGDEGLEAYCRLRPDLVISDVVMPNRDGIETIRELRKLDAGLPILAMSGSGLYVGIAAKLGATEALSKPFEFDELLALVRRLLDKAPCR